MKILISMVSVSSVARGPVCCRSGSAADYRTHFSVRGTDTVVGVLACLGAYMLPLRQRRGLFVRFLAFLVPAARWLQVF